MNFISLKVYTENTKNKIVNINDYVVEFDSARNAVIIENDTDSLSIRFEKGNVLTVFNKTRSLTSLKELSQHVEDIGASEMFSAFKASSFYREKFEVEV